MVFDNFRKKFGKKSVHREEGSRLASTEPHVADGMERQTSLVSENASLGADSRQINPATSVSSISDGGKNNIGKAEIRKPTKVSSPGRDELENVAVAPIGTPERSQGSRVSGGSLSHMIRQFGGQKDFDDLAVVQPIGTPERRSEGS